MIKYSFIIPVLAINDYIREAIPNILLIERDDYEIIIYPDSANNESWPKTRQVASGPGGPAMKRTLAMRDALGEILIFVDDDAYPEKNFLDILEQNFMDENIVAVGGPAITPDHDTIKQKISGAVFLSSLSGGFPERYASVGKKKNIDDWPSVNLSVRKKDFISIGGFDSDYWPGEDTKLCIDLIEKSGGKILYDPELIVFHHRREGLLRHLRQIGNYGIHRGFFAKKFPKTSLKIKYFLPSLFLLFVVIGGIVSFSIPLVFKIYLLGWLVYFLALVKAGFDIHKYEKNPVVIVRSLYYVLFTHLYYGWRFIRGLLLTRELKSKFR